jgi:Arc/MetJ-type ribon-helix-helix transcriptional regulator
MEHFNISVPEDAREAIEQGARDGGFLGPGEYVAALVRDHRQRRDALIAALIEGEQSGIDERSIEDIIADGRRRAGL